MNLYAAKVIWYDSENHLGPATDYLMLAADNHTGAMSLLEKCYGDHIETAEITLINPNGAYIYVDEKIYNGIIKEGFC
jgi:hypothetical protein